MLIEGVWMADVPNLARQSPEQQHRSRRGGMGTTPPHDKCSVGERLYSHGHVCNHARCAANNPDYNVKAAVPPKKFLVAKKHTYGGLDKGAEKTRTKSGNSTTTSSDHHCDRNHALQSLTNSVLTTENGKARSNGTTAVLTTQNGKTRSNGRLRSVAQSVLQQSRATRDTSSLEGKKVVAERKGRSSSHSSNSASSGIPTGRSSVTTESVHSAAQKSRLSNATSSMPSPATEQTSKQWEDSASPESSITSIRITQIISTRRPDEEKEENDAAASSPTASVGSNRDNDISSLKETTTVMVVEQGNLEQSTANLGDLLYSPAASESSSSNNNLPKNSVNKETTFDSPSPSVDSRPTTVSESLFPSTSSTSFAPGTPERSSLRTTPVSDISSSALLKSADGEEEINFDSSTPSVASSRPTASESLTSSVTSIKSGPRRSPTSNGRSSLTTPPPSSATRLARKFINNLKERSRVGSPRPTSSSPGASSNRPPRISRNSDSPAPTDSSPAPTNASRLTKKFITDLEGRTVARKASTKGVRSIELRGGKAQSYSTTTVTSWNVTTTTVETSVSSGSTPERNVDSALSVVGPLVEVSIKIPEKSSTKESQAAAARPNDPTVILKPLNEAPPTVKVIKTAKSFEKEYSDSENVSLKFVKNARSYEEVHSGRETVSLKHGEVAERRLSEEYLTNHALEKKISDKDHRVKVLVHAFETLGTLSDAEVPGNEDGSLNSQLVHESMTATTVTV